MNDAASLLILLLPIVIAVAMAAFAVHSAAKMRKTYHLLAQRFGGQCHEGGIFNKPSIRFVHQTATVLLDVHPTGRKRPKYYTQCHISWPDQAFRCEVYPERFMSRVGKLLGMQDVEIGSRAFDRDYIITGSDVRALRGFLTPIVQQRIDFLKAFGQEGIYFSASGGRLLIKHPGHIQDYSQLERFVLLSLDLYDEAIAAYGKGIEFTKQKPEATLSLQDAVCQICGEDVRLDAVFCRSCKTPHHLDCWAYYGACSTYGCGQKRYLVQRKPSRQS